MKKEKRKLHFQFLINQVWQVFASKLLHFQRVDMLSSLSGRLVLAGRKPTLSQVRGKALQNWKRCRWSFAELSKCVNLFVSGLPLMRWRFLPSPGAESTTETKRSLASRCPIPPWNDWNINFGTPLMQLLPSIKLIIDIVPCAVADWRDAVCCDGDDCDQHCRHQQHPPQPTRVGCQVWSSRVKCTLPNPILFWTILIHSPSRTDSGTDSRALWQIPTVWSLQNLWCHPCDTFKH